MLNEKWIVLSGLVFLLKWSWGMIRNRKNEEKRKKGKKGGNSRLSGFLKKSRKQLVYLAS